MKAQHKSAHRTNKLESAPAPSKLRRSAPESVVRDEAVKRARRRLASGFYDSEACLDITVRRIARELRSPAVVVTAKSPRKLPGRMA